MREQDRLPEREGPPPIDDEHPLLPVFNEPDPPSSKESVADEAAVATPPPASAACTPPDTAAVPVPEAEPDLEAPEYFLNRELTWLNFNFRVLHEAADERTPLLERVKFIAIVSSNLDEFFMKRIGGLKEQVGAGFHEPTIDGRTPQQQIEECRELVVQLENRKRVAAQRIVEELEAHDVRIASYGDLSSEDQAYLRDYYIENIYPLVTPQATDPAHPFPFLSNLSLNLLVTLHYESDADGPAPSLARVKVPVGTGIPRLLRLQDKNTFVRMESVIANNLDLLFPGMIVDNYAFFRVTRNANTERAEEKADDLLSMIESELRDRKFAPIVRLDVSTKMDPHYRGMLAAELGLDEAIDVFEVEGMLGMRDLMELTRLSEQDKFQGPTFCDPPHYPLDHPELDPERNIFHIVRERGSFLLHHPYDSFSTTVERFLREASHDPKVRAIKMCLYRTSSDSKAVQYLIDAAANGKQVAVVVELKARFDEEANIRWANRLEEAGIHVTYGVVGLKTHSKTTLVVRQDHYGLRRYAHIGTGNYHAGTARLYSDLGLLTADRQIGRDLTELFNYLTTGYKPKRNYEKILPSPKVAKQHLLAKIAREVDASTSESPGLIQFKMNALEDPTITRALYRAAAAGVQVDLILRDTCRLRPGISGLSDRVRVVSIVGRFLEHARIYYFQNAGDEEYYIGSADCMKRNLNSRVEAFVPVEDPTHREQLRFVLDTQLDDQRSAWDMRADGSYVQRGSAAGTKKTKSSQEAMIEYHEKRFKSANRLRRRKPRGADTRNVR